MKKLFNFSIFNILIVILFQIHAVSEMTYKVVPENSMPESRLATEWKIDTLESRNSDINSYYVKTLEGQTNYIFYFFSLDCPPCQKELKRFYQIQRKYPSDVTIVPVLSGYDTDKTFKQKSEKFFRSVDARIKLPNGEFKNIEWVIRDNNNRIIRRFYKNSGGLSDVVYKTVPHFFIFKSIRGGGSLTWYYSNVASQNENDPNKKIDEFEKSLSEE